MVLVQRGPQDTGKEYPRTVEDASLPSSSSSWPPLRRVSFLFSSACLPSVLLSFLLVNMPLPSPIRISTRKGNRRLLQMLHTKRDIISLFRSLSLSLSPLFSLFSSLSFLLSRSLFHFLFFFFSLRVFHHHFPSISVAASDPRSTCRETFVRITKSRGFFEGSGDGEHDHDARTR